MSNRFDAKVIFLMGPTASGKTALAKALIKEFPLEIISVDSAMVYRGMDIGTAKPTPAELKDAPHRLINLCEPNEAYSAARFVDDARQAIEEVLANGRWPLLVGGTMLYFNALLNGLSSLPEADAGVRAKLEQLINERGISYLHQRLSAVDPDTANRLHPNDRQRLIRALEVYELTKQPLSAFFTQETAELPYPVLSLGLFPDDREWLHSIIKQRLDTMLADGFEQEVKALIERNNVTPDLPALRSVGYRQMYAYLQGELSYDEMVAKANAATRQLAKRQITWLRQWQHLYRLDPCDPQVHTRAKQQILSFLY